MKQTAAMKSNVRHSKYRDRTITASRLLTFANERECKAMDLEFAVETASKAVGEVTPGIEKYNETVLDIARKMRLEAQSANYMAGELADWLEENSAFREWQDGR